MDVELPNGTVVKDVPDGFSKADLVAKLKANGHDVSGLEAPAAPKTSPLDYRLPPGVMGGMSGRQLVNIGAGALRGAGSIGATLIRPFESGAENEQRRQDMTGALGELGADTSSGEFKAGKLGGEIAGTAGAGGLLANGARAAGAAPAIVNALATNGFRTGAALPFAQNLAVRSAAGAAAGGAQVGLADPEHAGTGAILGGVVPGLAQGAGYVGKELGAAARSGAEGLMASALKATAKAKRTGEEQTAIETLLEKGINVSRGGVRKMRGMVDDLNAQIADKIGTSTAEIDPSRVVNALDSTRQRFSNQVSPTSDLNAIAGVQDDFLNTVGAGKMPVQLAQTVKQGTNRLLRDKYGQLGTAEDEAQKGLVRGLKEEIATAVPGIGQLNAEESKLIAALNVTERRVLQNASKDPVGLGIFALKDPVAFGTWMANRSPVVKSLIARMLNTTANGLPEGVNALAGPAAYRAIPSTARR